MDELGKRDFLKRTVLLGTAAVAPSTTLAGDEGAVDATTAVPPDDLLDEHFDSASGRYFGSQVIHHGEQPGYQVTPISQDKTAPNSHRAMRVGNLMPVQIQRRDFINLCSASMRTALNNGLSDSLKPPSLIGPLMPKASL